MQVIKHSVERDLSIGIIIIYGIIVFSFSYFNVWQGDDLNYRMFMTEENSVATYSGDKEPVQSVYDIFDSQITHYKMVNGRGPAHFLVQLFCGILGQGWFAVFNALFHLGLICLILSVVGGKLLSPKQLLSAIGLVVLGLSTKFSPSCQIGYIWTFTVILGFIKIFLNKKNLKNFWLYPLLFVYSLLAGWSQESLAIGIGGALILYALCNIRRMTVTQWIAFFGFGIGGLLLCLAPGTLNRASSVSTPLLMSFLNLLLGLRAFYVMLIVLVIYVFKKQLTFRDFYNRYSFYVNGIIVLLCFNILLGVAGNRQLLGIELLSVVITMNLLKSHSFNNLVLCLGYAFIIWQVGIQGYVTYWNRLEYDRFDESFRMNRDGRAYLDLPQLSMTRYALIEDFNPTLSILLKHEYPIITQKNEFFANYGKRDYYSFIPGILEKSDTVNLSTSAIKIASGEYLCIENDSLPADFVAHRSIIIGGIKIKYIPYTIPMDSVRFKGKHWSARVFGNTDMQRLYVDSVTVHIKPLSNK